MPILRDIPISLTAEQIIAMPKGGPIRPALLQSAEEALALGQTLWQPQVVYNWCDVQAVDGETVTVSAPEGAQVALHVGPKADLLLPAERALVGVVTIGPALEQKVHELQAAGESIAAYLLDSAGVLALGAAGEAMRCLAEETAAGLGWLFSIRL